MGLGGDTTLEKGMPISHGAILYYVVTGTRNGTENKEDAAEKRPAGESSTNTESGWDNPFRPDGDLSKEADEIVEAIKGGRPISAALLSPSSPNKQFTLDHTDGTAPQTESPVNKKVVTTNKTAPNASSGKAGANGAVEVHTVTVAPSDGTQAEHVVLKKKPKCKCCVIQ